MSSPKDLDLNEGDAPIESPQTPKNVEADAVPQENTQEVSEEKEEAVAEITEAKEDAQVEEPKPKAEEKNEEPLVTLSST